jgi:hypothetical protein
MAGLLLLGHGLGDGNENLDSQKSDAVLIVAGKMLEQRNHFFDDGRGGHFLDELGKVCGSLSPDHGRVVVDERAELLSKLVLELGRDPFVRSYV